VYAAHLDSHLPSSRGSLSAKVGRDFVQESREAEDRSTSHTFGPKGEARAAKASVICLRSRSTYRKGYPRVIGPGQRVHCIKIRRPDTKRKETHKVEEDRTYGYIWA